MKTLLQTETLEEILTKVEIYPDRVCHTDYPSDPLAEEFTQLFQQLSIELQQRYLKLELQDLLYRVYFSREVNLSIQQDVQFANDTVRGVDIQFFEKLRQSNCGRGYYDRGWQVRKQEADGMLAVYKDKLTIHIHRDRHLAKFERQADIGDFVSVLLPNSAIENHYYVAISNFGRVHGSTIDFFFNLKLEAAANLVNYFTRSLKCPFVLRTAFDPESYRYCDSSILSIHRRDYSEVWNSVKSFYRSQSSLFLEPVPFLTKRVGTGLAISESSTDAPFGQHRCGLIAEALISSGDRRIDAVSQQFTQMNLNLAQPYLDSDSFDCYESL